jgi:hypothetical protein
MIDPPDQIVEQDEFEVEAYGTFTPAEPDESEQDG